jgi:hypothetical protein
MTIENRPSARRSRWLLGALIVFLAGLVSACDGSGGTPSHRSVSSSALPADLLDRLTDRGDDSFVSSDPDVLLHEQATGPTRFVVKPGPGVTGLDVYVACAPASNYSVQMVGDSTKFFSGPCDTEFQNFGGLPLAGSGDQVQLDLTLPRGVHSWVVALPSRK